MADNLSLLVAQIQTKWRETGTFAARDLLRLQRRHVKDPQAKQPFYTKAEILECLKKWHKNAIKGGKNWQIESKWADLSENEQKRLFGQLERVLQVKPVRTQSGVATATLLTKPWACPGNCLFCPADVRMPKSYLANEPGAQRAETNFFDPYLQMHGRLEALQAMGHKLDKIEVIVLGGTWDSYPLPYRIWFIKRVFEALNDFGEKKDQSAGVINYYENLNRELKQKKQYYLTNKPAENQQNWAAVQKKVDEGELSYNQLIADFYLAAGQEKELAKTQTATWAQLEKEQAKNATGKVRNVGLVIETRPDLITEKTLFTNRKFGCTKIQIGVQSVTEKVLELNQRRISVTQIAASFALLRQFGFKIHAHFMANLYGSTPEQDIEDYRQLVSDRRFVPDEIKLYPCSLLRSAPLFAYYEAGKWQPYSEEELLKVLTANLAITPEYIRITRMIRDFSSHDIVAGNKKTNFRQLVEAKLRQDKTASREIRGREIRGQKVTLAQLQLRVTRYEVAGSGEYFLQFVTRENKIAGFLRLSLPNNSKIAMIREVHVYGVVSNLGEKGTSQHLGLGKKLIARAEKIARENDYSIIKVISAIGTREYYQKLGFELRELYQEKKL